MPTSRSTRAHQKVLNAALKLFASHGIDATSMDAIAAESGVSKATIYKHWLDKDALCLDVMAYLQELEKPPILPTGDHRRDIVAVLSPPRPVRPSYLHTRMMPHFMAYAARNHAFAKAWRACMMRPTRLQLVRVLKSAIAEGSLPGNLDLELSVALLAGPMMYRHVLALIGRQLPEDMAQRVVDTFWKAYGVRDRAPNTNAGTNLRSLPKARPIDKRNP